MKGFICLLSLIIGLNTNAGQQANFADLDKRNSVMVGETITIESQFKRFPLVEPNVSAHPSNNNHLLVSAMAVTDIQNPYESCRLSSFSSKDAGLTWTETAHDWWGYDPWTAILPDGQTAMSWLGTKGSFQREFPLQFFTSADGGQTWGADVQTFQGKGHGHDGTKLVAYGNEFYYTTVRFNGNMGADVVLYRRVGGGVFEEVAKIEGKGKRLNFCEPAILSDGTVLVPASNYLTKVWVQAYDHDTGQLSEPYNFSIRPGGARGYMRMAADVGINSEYRDRAYFVRALGSNGGYDGLWLNYSSDKGKTWTGDTRIDLFDSSLPSKAQVPSVAINNRGVVGVSWVDSQNDPVQKKNDVYFAMSLDGGHSFQRPVRVTTISSDPRTELNGDVANRFPGGGHYLGISSKPDGSFQLVWSDSRSGKFELQTANVKIR